MWHFVVGQYGASYGHSFVTWACCYASLDGGNTIPSKVFLEERYIHLWFHRSCEGLSRPNVYLIL
jgi:hypothetical protein